MPGTQLTCSLAGSRRWGSRTTCVGAAPSRAPASSWRSPRWVCGSTATRLTTTRSVRLDEAER
eukprot:2979695-Rhodomonas_salina.2